MLPTRRKEYSRPATADANNGGFYATSVLCLGLDLGASLSLDRQLWLHPADFGHVMTDEARPRSATLITPRSFVAKDIQKAQE